MWLLVDDEMYQFHSFASLLGDCVRNTRNSWDKDPHFRLEAFIRRADRHGYCADTTPTLSSLFDKAYQTLFDNTITSSTHPLHILLPPKVQKHYSTRPRGHCYQLPLLHLTKAISFIVYYIVTFYRLSLLIDISISDV